MGAVRAGVRMAAAVISQAVFLILAALLVFLFWWSRPVRWRLAAAWGRIWARLCCRILNIRIHRTGEPLPREPVLIVANHIGSPDIFVLGALFKSFFVAKLDVRTWPFIGWMAEVGGSVFVDRDRRQSAGGLVAAVATRLGRGFNVIMFPEGRATDGSGIAEFKTPGFEAAIRAGCPVQPVLLTYHDAARPSVACWRDTPFLSHLWRLLKQPGLEVTARLLPRISGAAGRRDLARATREALVRVHTKNRDAAGESPFRRDSGILGAP